MQMMERTYDRSAEDLGNIVGLEHVNTRVPDQRLATLYYMSGLGLTRDPFLMTGVVNMWANVGRSQFHLPTGEPQVLRGITGLVIPDRQALLHRLERVREPLAGTQFEFHAANDHVDTVSPWGNRVRVHTPDPDRFGRIQLGMPYLLLEVPVGTAKGIARFYQEILEAPAEVVDDDGAKMAKVASGHCQWLYFRETRGKRPEYDRHHIQVYLANFSRPHARLKERGLITEESNQHQYRFEDIVDLKSGKVLFTLEHEIRSMTNPLYARPLINRNTAQTNNEFAPGHEEQPWAMAYGA